MNLKPSLTSITFGVLFFLFNYLDGVMTLYLVKLGGLEVELNPLMRKLMEEIGEQFLYPKVAMGVLIGGLIILFWDKYKWWKVCAVGLVCLYSLMVTSHVVGIWGLSYE